MLFPGVGCCWSLFVHHQRCLKKKKDCSFVVRSHARGGEGRGWGGVFCSDVREKREKNETNLLLLLVVVMKLFVLCFIVLVSRLRAFHIHR